ncbi:unnamed protein product, partial [Symbiodinium necroappetens]
ERLQQVLEADMRLRAAQPMAVEEATVVCCILSADPARSLEGENLPDALPLVLRPSFQNDLMRWDKLLSCPDTKVYIFKMTQADLEANIFAPPQKAPPTQDHQVDILSRLVLKHEEALAEIRKDTGYIMFFRQDDKSILPNLMEVAKQWRAKVSHPTEDSGIASPLRTVLINCLLKELLHRTQRVVSTETGREDLKKIGWLDQNDYWVYLKWSSQQRRLIVDSTRAPLTHDEMIRIITDLQACMTGEIIHHFKSKAPMWRIEEEGHAQATFDLGISLRSSTADDVHHNFGKIMGNSVTSLIGMSMKKDNRPRQPQAVQLAQLVYSGPDIQSLIQRWHQQSSVYAMHAYIIPKELLLPCLLWGHRDFGCAVGHYRTLVSAGSDYWILDDARAAERADEDQLEIMATPATSQLQLKQSVLRVEHDLHLLRLQFHTRDAQLEMLQQSMDMQMKLLTDIQLQLQHLTNYAQMQPTITALKTTPQAVQLEMLDD